MKKNTIIKAFATFVAGCLVMGTVGCGSVVQTKEPFVITNTVGTVMVSENGENSVSTKDDGSVDFDLDDTKKVGLDVVQVGDRPRLHGASLGQVWRCRSFYQIKMGLPICGEARC